MSKINTTSGSFKSRKIFILQHFMSNWNLMLSWTEPENCFTTLGPVHKKNNAMLFAHSDTIYFSFTGMYKRSRKTWFPTVYPTISPNENFECGYPYSNSLLQFCLTLECCKLHKATRHPTKCDVINDVKLFVTVYSRIFLTLSRYPIRCRNTKDLQCLLLYTCPDFQGKFGLRTQFNSLHAG